MASPDMVEWVRKAALAPASALECVESAIVVSEALRSEADELLDCFVNEARQAGHSWAEIGQRLGVSKQAALKRYGTDDGVTLRPRLRRCLDQAAEAARADGSVEVTNGHLLLGLLREGVASAVLERLGIHETTLRTAIHAPTTAPGHAAPSAQPPLSEEASEAIASAIGFARERRSKLVGTEHLLFVLATEVGSRSRKLLESLGVSAADVKRELACFVDETPPRRRRRRRRQASDRTSE